MHSMTFKIRGLDCAEEVAVLQRAVGPVVGGEAHLAFDILNGTMTVRPAQETVSEAAVRQAVARTGMQALPWQEAGASPRPETVWQRHGRTTLCLASGLLLARACCGMPCGMAVCSMPRPPGTAAAIPFR
jgi:Cd2+/Zn2+-exporting ATPase